MAQNGDTAAVDIGTRVEPEARFKALAGTHPGGLHPDLYSIQFRPIA